MKKILSLSLVLGIFFMAKSSEVALVKCGICLETTGPATGRNVAYWSSRSREAHIDCHHLIEAALQNAEERLRDKYPFTEEDGYRQRTLAAIKMHDSLHSYASHKGYASIKKMVEAEGVAEVDGFLKLMDRK